MGDPRLSGLWEKGQSLFFLQLHPQGSRVNLPLPHPTSRPSPAWRGVTTAQGSREQGPEVRKRPLRRPPPGPAAARRFRLAGGGAGGGSEGPDTKPQLPAPAPSTSSVTLIR